jgi:hypothetical protein
MLLVRPELEKRLSVMFCGFDLTDRDYHKFTEFPETFDEIARQRLAVNFGLLAGGTIYKTFIRSFRYPTI